MLPEKWVVVHEPCDSYFKEFRKWFAEQYKHSEYHLTAHWLSYYYNGKDFDVTDAEIKSEDYIKLTPKQVLEMIEQQENKEWIPKRGDIVMVKGYNTPRILAAFIEGAYYPYMLVDRGSESDFKRDKPFNMSQFKDIIPYKAPIVEITLEEIAKLKNCDVSQIRIKE